MKINRKNDLEYITFDNLEQTGLVKHCFTTRHGGVSTDYWASMNMGFARGEKREPVLQNYKILAEAVGFTAENYVTSQQTHTTNVRRVTAADAGKGVWTERGYTDVDGLITNEKHIPLVIFGADCVPVFLLDKKNHAIGVAHCGWVGTGNRMAEKILQEMMRTFGTDPADVTAAIGLPSGNAASRWMNLCLRCSAKTSPGRRRLWKKTLRQRENIKWIYGNVTAACWQRWG